ncbi:MAG: hypothetical protein PHV77_04740 [Candidatus Omnitrophica bacterium]|nr:hypothetical protein [Candidatus Omnitrophota bacterium]
MTEEASIGFLASLGMTGVLCLSSRAAEGEAGVSREGSGSERSIGFFVAPSALL